MSNPEEIEVEVVEVVDGPAISRPDQAETRHQRPPNSQSRRPFGGMQAKSLRIPIYLWPLAIIFGLVLLMIALVVGVVIAIPLLIIRAIARLMR